MAFRMHKAALTGLEFSCSHGINHIWQAKQDHQLRRWRNTRSWLANPKPQTTAFPLKLRHGDLQTDRLAGGWDPNSQNLKRFKAATKHQPWRGVKTQTAKPQTFQSCTDETPTLAATRSGRWRTAMSTVLLTASKIEAISKLQTMNDCTFS